MFNVVYYNKTNHVLLRSSSWNITVWIDVNAEPDIWKDYDYDHEAKFVPTSFPRPSGARLPKVCAPWRLICDTFVSCNFRKLYKRYHLIIFSFKLHATWMRSHVVRLQQWHKHDTAECSNLIGHFTNVSTFPYKSKSSFGCDMNNWC